jgi:hypothetical protein
MRWEGRKVLCLQRIMPGSRAAYETFNDREFDRAAALIVEDLEWVNVATGETFREAEGYKQDMHLSVMSPAIDAGSSTNAPNVDVESNARPYGSPTYNMGAYELGSTSPLAPDTTLPEISNVQVSNIKHRSITIPWTADEASTTSVQYAHTTAYVKLKSDTAFIVRRSMILTGPSTDTRYRCWVTSEDEAGNDTAYTELTFRKAR